MVPRGAGIFNGFHLRAKVCLNVLAAEPISASGSGDRSRLLPLTRPAIVDDLVSDCSEGSAFAGSGKAETGEGVVLVEFCLVEERPTPLVGFGGLGASFCSSELMFKKFLIFASWRVQRRLKLDQRDCAMGSGHNARRRRP